MTDGAVKVFFQPAAAFGSFEVEEHSFFCPGRGEGRGFAEEKGAEVVGEAEAIPEEITVAQCGDKGNKNRDCTSEGGD